MTDTPHTTATGGAYSGPDILTAGERREILRREIERLKSELHAARAVAQQAEDYVRDEVPQQIEDARDEGHAAGVAAERQRILSFLRTSPKARVFRDGRQTAELLDGGDD